MKHQIPRKQIWFNCDIELLISLTKWCKKKGYTRNKIIERAVRKFMEENENDIQNQFN